MSTFTDDFSSGSLAGYTGVTDIATTPTGGPSGGTGIIATGTASQQYYGEIEKVFATRKRHGRAAFTFNCAAAAYSSAGNYNIDIRTASAASTILYCSQSGTDPYALDIFNTFPPGGSATPALTIHNILPGGTFTRVELRFQLSTDVLGALSFDGWWRVLVDGVGMGGETNVQIGVPGHGWGAVGFSPMGAGSDVLISDDDVSILTTVLPGPLSGDVSFIVMPDGDSPYPYGAGNPTYVCSGVGQTTGSPLRTVTTEVIAAATANPTVALCGTRGGGWWQATDTSGHTTLLKYRADGTIDRTVVCANLLCTGRNATFGYAVRSLMELPNGHLLTIIRSSGVVVEVSTTDGSVVTTYSLTIASFNGFDGAVNSDGTRLVYLDVASGGPTDVNVWDLTNDVSAGTLFTDDADNAWSLVWLADCSLAFMVDTGVSMTPARRYSFDGALLGTYAYDEATFPSVEQTYGIAASVAANRLWMIRDWDEAMSSEQPAVLVFNLSTTAPVIQIPLVSVPFDYDAISALGQPYVAIRCVPFPPPPTTATYPVRRLRRLKLAYDNNLLLTVDRIELKMQVGEGTIDVPNPQVMLRVSKDGSRTWSTLRMCSGGRMGEYSQRVYWNRFGQGRDWVLEFTFSDPVPWYAIEVLADVTEGTS